MITPKPSRFVVLLALTMTMGIGIPGTLGQDSSAGAKTASDPLIPMDELELLLQIRNCLTMR